MPAERFADLNQLAAALRKVFGRVPRETNPRPVGQWVVIGLALLILVILVGILIAATYFQQVGGAGL
jgi:hypothetical protein